MHDPGMLWLGNLPVVVQSVINGGVFTLIRYLGRPNPGIALEQLVNGIATMVAAYVGAELASAGAARAEAGRAEPTIGKGDQA